MDGSGFIASTARAGKPVRVEYGRLTPGGRGAGAAKDAHSSRDPALRVLVGSGRGSALHGESMPALVFLPLWGRLHLADGDNRRVLRPGQLFVSEAGQTIQAVGNGPALWVAFQAPSSVWRQLFNALSERQITEPVLIAATQEANRAVRRAAVRLAREARLATSSAEAAAAAFRFATMLADLQSAFDPMIKRCPGRTLAQRRGVFLRLQRVYLRMEASSDLDLNVGVLAQTANYSPCHFVRTFSAVYGETPHAVLVEQRLKRAMRLVHNTELSITEVARASGFDDRCAFARSFKRRFGRTASAVRERGMERSLVG